MDDIIYLIFVWRGWVGMVELEFSPAVINAVTLSACLTSHTTAHTAHGGQQKEPQYVQCHNDKHAAD